MKGLGLELDAADVVAGDVRDRHVASLVGAERAYAERRDWRDALDFVPDQGGSSTCVAWYFSTALYLAGQASGVPIARPSVRWLYAIGHWLRSPGTPISPGGRSMRATAQAAAKHGLIAEARWPFDELLVTDDRIPFDVDVAASDARFMGYYAIGGGDVGAQIRMALDKGHFPGIAINVRESFDDYRGGLYAPAGPSRGWHAICSIAYTPEAVCFVRNWGADDGENGYVWIPDTVLNSPDVADAIVVTAAPAGVR